MEAREFDEGEFFRAIAACGARVLLIGRRAMREGDVADIRLLQALGARTGGGGA